MSVMTNKSNINVDGLIKHAELKIRERIEGLRKQCKNSSKPSKREMTGSSKDIVIAAKNMKIEQLEKENKFLKEQLMVLIGKLYDTI
jgi:hypothetical protein